MNDNEKRPDTQISTKSNSFLKWLENYWYHYKWHTIIAAFVIVVLGVCFWQMTEKEEYDITLVYAGRAQPGEAVMIAEVVSSVIPYDYNGDDEKKAAVHSYLIYSKNEIAWIDAQTDEDSRPVYDFDKSFNVSEYNNFNSDMSTGGASVCFLAPWLYEEFSKEHLCPLSEVFGENIPAGAIDEYGIRLGDTELYKTYSSLHKIPADTVICLETSFLSEKLSKDNEKKFRFEKDVFAAIVNFKPVDSETTTPQALLPEKKKYDI